MRHHVGRLYWSIERFSLKRRIQPAGLGRDRPLRYRYGFCLRLRRRWHLLVVLKAQQP